MTERDTLIVDHLHVALRLARKAKRRYGWMEWGDLVSAAQLGLVQAAIKFEPARQLKFATFAQHRIWGAIGDQVRVTAHERGYVDRAGRRVRFCSFDAAPAAFDVADPHVQAAYVRVLPAWLSARQQRILSLRLLGWEHAEIGRTMGVTHSRVSQILKEVRALLAA